MEGKSVRGSRLVRQLPVRTARSSTCLFPSGESELVCSGEELDVCLISQSSHLGLGSVLDPPPHAQEHVLFRLYGREENNVQLYRER